MYFTHFINALLMVVLPVSLSFLVVSKYKISWRLWWIGGTIFVLSQIGHIPFNNFIGQILNKTNMVYWTKTNQVIFNALFLGVSAGIWEEFARYAMYRWWSREARNWRTGILLGLGHGGFESIIIGLIALYTFLQMMAIRNIDISSIVPPAQLSNATKSISIYWAMPWYDSLIGSFERALTLPIQIALSLLILQVFLRKKIKWLWAAIGYHAIVDTTAVLLISFTNVYITELLIILFSIFSIWIIFYLRSSEFNRGIVSIKPGPDEEKIMIEDVLETIENLDDTIYKQGVYP